MARLETPPRKARDSSAPTSSHTSTDAEAATQQLLAESRASMSIPTQSSAVLGANLLNAARIDYRYSSPAGMARKAGAGKLKRPSSIAEDPRRNLASRGDVYDVELSPEKGTFRLPETVNHQPLKVVHTKRKIQAENRERSVNEDGQPDEPDSKVQLPSSPPGYTANDTEGVELEGHLSAEDVQIEQHLPNNKPRCRVVFYRNDGKGPHYQQCSLTGTHHIDAGPRCHIHVNKPATVRCGAATVHENIPLQCRAPASTETSRGARCSFHAEFGQRHDDPHVREEETRGQTDEGDKNVRKKLKRKFEDDSDNDRRPKAQRTQVAAGKTQPQVQIPTRRKPRQKTTRASAAMGGSHAAEQNPVLSTTGAATVEPLGLGKWTKSRRQASNGTISSIQPKPATKQKSGDPTKASKQAGSAGREDEVDDEVENDELDANESDPDADKNDNSEQPIRTSGSGDIDAVLKFLDLEERPGKCQTKLGTSIKRVCEKSCVVVQEEETSIGTIIAESEDLRAVLNQVDEDVSGEDQDAFKSDAYTYIFRALTLYFEAVYSWFAERCDEVTDSLEAIRVLLPLIHDILALKATIAKWKVSIPQRYKGDKIVMDVDSGFIAPLRQLERTFRVRLSQLRAKEQRRQKYAELARKCKEDATEERRRAEAIVARRERWRRWQNLHISRMQCEPDPLRRRKLVITKLEDVDEKDANGIKFERLLVFKTRSSPPLRWTSTVSEQREWTEDEETALLDGMKSFAGPCVFEKIFNTYCRPGGQLRDFSVADIVTKTAWVRSAWLQLQQEKDWELPEWVRTVPALS